MTTSSAMTDNRYHVRSISMPSQYHPCAERIEEVLTNLRNWETTSVLKAEVICNGLSGLTELYSSVRELLQFPLTQQQVIHQEHAQRVNEVLDGSVRLFDMCSTSRDILVSMKEQVQNLQSTLRRKRSGESSLEKEIHAYMCFRKKVKKDAAKCIKALKQMNTRSASTPLQEQNQHLSMAIRILRGAGLITISIFQSILVAMSAPKPKTRNTILTLVSKVMHKGQVVCEGVHESTGEVQSLDDELNALCHHVSGKDDAERVQGTQVGLKALEASIEGIDSGLECLYRHLIQTRVSMLNILT